MTDFSRRGFLTGVAGASAAGWAAGLTSPQRAGASMVASPSSSDAKGNDGADAGQDAGRQESDTSAPLADQIEPFDGEHQAGVSTPVQSSLNLVAFDLNDDVSPRQFVNLMRLWTTDARALCTGESPRGSLEPELADAPANLTISCGFGEPLFAKLGLEKEKPDWLRDIKYFDRDKLDPQWGQTDLVLQICCDDKLTAAHALRHMVRSGSRYAHVVWLQQGFQNTPGLRAEKQTPRNLFGQKDGTVNPRTSEDFAQQVWIDDGPQWQRGGTALVARRIRMNMETWEEADRPTRETAIGRDLPEGAPLSGGDEFTPVDFDKRDKYGLPAVDRNSHIARAQPPKDHPEQRILRRAYNYDLPPDPHTPDQLSNSGLIFLAYQKDPTKQFEPIQSRLDEADFLNEWITHIGSAVYVLPPGTQAAKDGGKRDTFWAESLIGALR